MASFADRIMRASLVIGAAHVLLKFLGLVQNILLAHFFGIEGRPEPDAFQFAFKVIYALFLIGEEAIGPAFLALFMEEKEKGGEASAWRFSNTVFTLLFLVLLPVTIVCLLFPELISGWMVPGFAEEGPEKIRLTGQLLRLAAPGLIGLTLGSLTYMILNGYKRFAIPALGDSVWKICLIAGILFGGLYLGGGERGIAAAAAAFFAGGFAKLVTHLWGLRDKIRPLLRPAWDLRSPVFVAFLLLILPCLLGNVFGKVREFYEMYLLSEFQGGVAALSFSRKITDAIFWIVPYAVAIAMFPYFAEMVVQKDYRQLGRVLGQAIRILLLFLVPVSFALAVSSLPLARLIFESGAAVGGEGVVWVGWTTACYCLVLFVTSLEAVTIQTFFAQKNTITPISRGILFNLLNMALCFLAIKVWHLTGRQALMAVALVFVACRSGKVLTFLVLLQRQLQLFAAREFLPFLGKLALIGAAVTAAALGGGALAERLAPFAPGSKLLLAAWLGTAGLAGGAAFLLLVWALRMEEFKLAVGWAREKFRGKKGKKGGDDEQPAPPAA